MYLFYTTNINDSREINPFHYNDDPVMYTLDHFINLMSISYITLHTRIKKKIYIYIVNPTLISGRYVLSTDDAFHIQLKGCLSMGFTGEGMRQILGRVGYHPRLVEHTRHRSLYCPI